MHKDREGGAGAAATESVVNRRPGRRALLAAVALAVCLLSAPVAASAAGAHGPKDLGGAAPVTEYGAGPVGGPRNPVSDADRDLLVKVRLAGLWETPAGEMAVQKGVSPRVREIGAMIGSQHRQLDALVVQAAERVGVALPDEPNADQQRWLNEMRSASGAEFDQVFVDRLRAAHGKVFPVIASVRAGTRDSVVRRFAQAANGYVLTHLTLLESTGLVDYASLPEPAGPPSAPSAATTATPDGGGVTNALTWVFRSPQAYPGLLVAIALLIIGPRTLRSVVRRRLSRGAGRRSGDRRPSARRRPPRRVVRREDASGPLPSPYLNPEPPTHPEYPRYPSHATHPDVPPGTSPTRRLRTPTRVRS